MAKTLPNSGMVIPEIGDGPADVTKLTDALTTLDSVIGTLKTNIGLLQTGSSPAELTNWKSGYSNYGSRIVRMGKLAVVYLFFQTSTDAAKFDLIAWSPLIPIFNVTFNLRAVYDNSVIHGGVNKDTGYIHFLDTPYQDRTYQGQVVFWTV